MNYLQFHLFFISYFLRYLQSEEDEANYYDERQVHFDNRDEGVGGVGRGWNLL